MFQTLHEKKPLQLVLGLLMGMCFGFLLHKGGVTEYEVILGQLLLQDWTVLRIMLSAVVVGMLGVFFMKERGWVEWQRKPGSFGATALGGVVFGVGFALLGYCPGTMAGAAGRGGLDAITAGIPGMILGTWLYVLAYPAMRTTILPLGSFGETTVYGLLGMNRWTGVWFACSCIFLLLLVLEMAGF